MRKTLETPGPLAASTTAAALALASSCAPGETPAFAIGQPAPDYAAATLAGDSVALSELRGDVVLLNLWATWCAPCRHETPFLQSVFENYRDRGFHIVGVSQETRDAAGQIAEFTEEYGVTYTILHDTQLRGDRIYHAPGLPATFLIDREGVLRWLRYGPVDEQTDGFIASIEAALGDVE